MRVHIKFQYNVARERDEICGVTFIRRKKKQLNVNAAHFATHNKFLCLTHTEYTELYK